MFTEANGPVSFVSSADTAMSRGQSITHVLMVRNCRKTHVMGAKGLVAEAKEQREQKLAGLKAAPNSPFLAPAHRTTNSHCLTTMHVCILCSLLLRTHGFVVSSRGANMKKWFDGRNVFTGLRALLASKSVRATAVAPDAL